MGTRLALASVGFMLATIIISTLPFTLAIIAVFPCTVAIATALFYKKL